MLQFFFKIILKLFFRVNVEGLEHYKQAGDKFLLVTNVGSLIDTLLLSIFLPQKICIIVDERFRKKWWMRPLLSCAYVLTVDFSSPKASLYMVKAIQKYQRCVVFHHELLYYDEHIIKLFEATALIAKKAKANILPIRIDGASYSYFTFSRHKMRLRLFPKTTLHILPHQEIPTKENCSAKENRHFLAVTLFKIITDLKVQSAKLDSNLVQALRDAISANGSKYIIAEDQERKTISYGTLFLKAHVLGAVFAKKLVNEKHVGFLLPGSLAGIVTFYALHIAKKIPAMLNFTAGAKPVVSACSTVQLQSVITSRRFIKLAELESLEKAIKDSGVRVLYLEDLAAKIPLHVKILSAIKAKLLITPKISADNTASIMFTSGTEGSPKAVFLSHYNILFNKEQICAIVDIHSGDRMFNALPMFHSFGLGVGTLLPLNLGIKLFIYPSPLHYRIVPKLFYESQSTIIFGTDTFFSGYARYGRPYDFANARLVIAGAEKLRKSTATLWKERYNIEILEGYGATEASPVISVNTPSRKQKGSIGKILPAIEYTLKKVEGIDEGGSLCVKSGNVMQGYMHASSPGILEPPKEDLLDGEGFKQGWYDTGDIVTVNEYGFVSIKGRAKRFAKLGGEMVSLAAVEIALGELWQDILLGIISIPDEKRGEQLVLIIEKEDVTTSQIAAFFASKGISALWVPKKIVSVKQAPILGSGKFDYATAKELALKAILS